MYGAINKLAVKLNSFELATALYEAGLQTPGAIRAAEDGEIVEAVGSENLAAVRARLAHREQ